MTVREHCGNCAFGTSFGSVYGELSCRRRAPIVFEGVTGSTYTRTGGPGSIEIMKEHRGAVTAWPKVNQSDFCGEWELKDAT